MILNPVFSATSVSSVANIQVPAPGELVLDHVAHFVPHIDEASAALERLGFTVTPFSAHSHRLQPGGPLAPAGTGNRCVMLDHGYLEIVTPTAGTPSAAQLRAAINRYAGVHLIAFGTAAPEADHARLEKEGFAPLAPVALQREIGTAGGTGTVRFTVVRVPPSAMPEGRIQFCRQDTPELIWQERWLAHANCAMGLTGVLLCVADPQEAARRYSRYTGLPALISGSVWRIESARGYLLFLDPDALERRLEVEPPSLPWMAGYVLESKDIAASGDVLRRSGVRVHPLGSGRLLVKLPAAVGGIAIFEPRNSGTLSLD